MMPIWCNGHVVLQKFEKAWSTGYEQSVVHMLRSKNSPLLCTLASFYDHNMSITPTKVKEKWTNDALKMPQISMYVAIMPLWRSNKGHLMGASCGHKGRHRPGSKFFLTCFAQVFIVLSIQDGTCTKPVSKSKLSLNILRKPGIIRTCLYWNISLLLVWKLTMMQSYQKFEHQW